MFEGLREEVDKARWRQQCRQWRKTAATILEVKRRNVYLALPADGVGDLLVAYYRPSTPQYEIWCLRVDARNGCAVGSPIRFMTIGEWVSHAQERAWEHAWADEL